MLPGTLSLSGIPSPSAPCGRSHLSRGGANPLRHGSRRATSPEGRGFSGDRQLCRTANAFPRSGEGVEERSDETDEGAPIDGAGGYSPLIRHFVPPSPQGVKALQETGSGMVEVSILALSVCSLRSQPPCSPFWLRHLPPTGGSLSKGEALAVRQSSRFCQGLSLWESCHRR